MEDKEKLVIPWNNIKYSDIYDELYHNNYELIEEKGLLPEFTRMFWNRYKDEMTEEDIEDLLDELEDANYHEARKELIETISGNSTELEPKQEKIEWKDLMYYYYVLFESLYENNVDYYNTYIADPKERIAKTGFFMHVNDARNENEEIRRATLTPFMEMFWNRYKEKMNTVDIELLLELLDGHNFGTACEILHDLVEKDNRETKQYIPIEAFRDENIEDTIDEYINKYGYPYNKLMEAMFEINNNEDLEVVFSDCGLDGMAYYYPDEETFETVRNYYMNEYRHTK